MATTVDKRATRARQRASGRRAGGRAASHYPYWFYLPAGIVYAALFLLPTFASFFFSLTRWDLFTYHFIGFKNFVEFFQEPALVIGLWHTLIYAADRGRHDGRSGEGLTYGGPARGSTQPSP